VSDAIDHSTQQTGTVRQQPEALTEQHRAIWRAWGERAGVAITVPPCPYSSTELDQLSATGRSVAYLPPEMATQGTRHLLGSTFPLMGCYSLLAENVVTNDTNAWGWFDFESSIDAPFANTTEAELRDQITSMEGLSLLTLNQYIVASQISRELTGSYLDERRTWARIGSRVTGRTICVRFDGDEVAEGLGDEDPVSGSLLTGYDLAAHDRMPPLGARTAGIAMNDRSNARTILTETVTKPGRHPAQARSVDLNRERLRLIGCLTNAGFHDELGMSADEYAASLPLIEAQPPEYRGRLDVPLLVETRIPFQRQFELVGIFPSQLLAPFKEPQPYDATSAHRAEPYAGWFSAWGQRFVVPISPDDARADLAVDEVGGNLIEAAAMQAAYPELNQTGRYFDYIGYVFAPPDPEFQALFEPIVRTAAIYRWRGRPEYACNLRPTQYELFRPLIRGARIATSTPLPSGA
jgi:hypothetical protein